jgi:hypothetical protein
MLLRATLKQEVIYTGIRSAFKSKDTIIQAVGPKINQFSTIDKVILLPVPNKIPVVHNTCPNIDIKYKIKVTLEIPGFFYLHCKLPVIITN